MNQRSKIINKLILGIVAFTIFITPLLFLPITPDFYDWNKRVFLLASGCLLTVLWSIKNVIPKSLKDSGEFERFLPKLDPPLLTLTTVTIISTFLNPAYVDGLMGRGVLFVALFLIYFVISQTAKEKGLVGGSIIASASILAFLSILQFLGLLETIPWSPAKTLGWTPAGNQFSQTTLIATALAISATKLLRFVFEQDSNKKSALFCGLAVPLLSVSLTIFTVNFTSTNTIIPLPLSSGWQIASRALGESIKSAFVGFGPGNFTPAFLLLKPIRLSRTPLWDTIFTTSSNEPFHLLTTVGLLGFGAWLWLVLRFIKNLISKIKLQKAFFPRHSESSLRHSEFGSESKSQNPSTTLRAGRSAMTEQVRSLPRTGFGGNSNIGIKPEEVGLAVVFLTQIVLPPNLLSWFLLFVLFANVLPKHTKEKPANSTREGRWLTAGLIITTIGALTYFTGRVYVGEIKLYQSFQAIDKNDGGEAYNLQLEALKLNPKKADYHRIFSRTNLALAQTLVQQINTAQNSTEEQQTQTQKNISQLVQQSINEAKTAIRLAPNQVQNWQNLAETYRRLGGMVDGAQDWALGAYNTAIALDPLNPNLRISRGGIFHSMQNWEEAVINFRTAVQIRPTLANGWYNLAAIYRENEQPEKAAEALQQILKASLIDAADRSKIEGELVLLKGKAAESTPSATPIPPFTTN